MSNPNTALAVKCSKVIIVNGKPALSTTNSVDMMIFGVPARGVEVERSGRLFLGHLYADPADADMPTAFFSYAGGGESDAYTISPCEGYRGRTTTVRDLAEVVQRALEWMEPPQ